jgi:hypothetical protein
LPEFDLTETPSKSYDDEAFPINVTFYMVFTSATLMTPELEGEWSASAGWERYASPPSNATLSEWGIATNRTQIRERALDKGKRWLVTRTSAG